MGMFYAYVLFPQYLAGLASEDEAYKLWWELRPTVADAFLLFLLVTLVVALWYAVRANRREGEAQIDEIKDLVLKNIAEIKEAFETHIETMKGVVSKLQEEKTLISEHLVRHEKITEDIQRLCAKLDDHEMRIRVTERWDGRLRREADKQGGIG